MRAIRVGEQSFDVLRKNDLFYVDKTRFLKEWWKNGGKVTLITRPRRFGKTLNMSMVERFFAVQYAGKSEVFEGLEVGEDREFMKLQGTYPVIFLTFAEVQEECLEDTIDRICEAIQELYRKYRFILKSGCFEDDEKVFFRKMGMYMEKSQIDSSLKRLSEFLFRYYGKNVIILLDEYDVPAQVAYLNGYWDELMKFYKKLCLSAFKTNPYLERGIITGVTRISKESIFSGFNNLKVVSMMSDEYADIFGFTEQEVFSALDEMGLIDKKNDVKEWYDGYAIGEERGIYNPWSVTNYLDGKKMKSYWANSSDNALISSLIQRGGIDVKKKMECLLMGKTLTVPIDEEIIFSQLGRKKNAIWSLLLASGYLKVAGVCEDGYELKIVNHEVKSMFDSLVLDWFNSENVDYNDFMDAMLTGNVKNMNRLLNEIMESTFSFFDAGQREPEKFYHGFVLGLLVWSGGQDYELTSNRESGDGRYDVAIVPRDGNRDAFILEFKVTKKDQSLENAADSALKQIEEKKYDRDLLSRGFTKERIKKYAFAFAGKNVLIKGADQQTA